MDEDLFYKDIQDVMSRFMYLYRASHEMLCQKAHDLVISPQQFHVLKIIQHNDCINQKELARILKITPATLSVRLKRLEKAGLLIREIDKDDKRNFILKVTQEGNCLIDSCHEFMKRNIILMFNGITNEEMDALKSCLIKIQHNLDRKKEDLNAKD